MRKGGFVVLDDSLVEMDLDRCNMASAAISEFSENQQVIVITFHPGLEGEFVD